MSDIGDTGEKPFFSNSKIIYSELGVYNLHNLGKNGCRQRIFNMMLCISWNQHLVDLNFFAYETKFSPQPFWEMQTLLIILFRTWNKSKVPNNWRAFGRHEPCPLFQQYRPMISRRISQTSALSDDCLCITQKRKLHDMCFEWRLCDTKPVLHCPWASHRGASWHLKSTKLSVEKQKSYIMSGESSATRAFRYGLNK